MIPVINLKEKNDSQLMKAETFVSYICLALVDGVAEKCTRTRKSPF